MNTPRRWYREPMLWLALGIPLTTVAAGVATLRLAFRGDTYDVEPQPVTRTAQAQETDLGPDLASARRHLQARLTHERAGDTVVVAVPGVGESEGPLTLDLVHPMFARQDRRIQLSWAEGAWHASAPWPPGKWKLILVDRRQRWRLTGRVDTQDDANRIDTALHSALAPR